MVGSRTFFLLALLSAVRADDSKCLHNDCCASQTEAGCADDYEARTNILESCPCKDGDSSIFEVCTKYTCEAGDSIIELFLAVGGVLLVGAALVYCYCCEEAPCISHCQDNHCNTWTNGQRHCRWGGLVLNCPDNIGAGHICMEICMYSIVIPVRGAITAWAVFAAPFRWAKLQMRRAEERTRDRMARERAVWRESAPPGTKRGHLAVKGASFPWRSAEWKFMLTDGGLEQFEAKKSISKGPGLTPVAYGDAMALPIDNVRSREGELQRRGVFDFEAGWCSVCETPDDEVTFVIGRATAGSEIKLKAVSAAERAAWVVAIQQCMQRTPEARAACAKRRAEAAADAAAQAAEAAADAEAKAKAKANAEAEANKRKQAVGNLVAAAHEGNLTETTRILDLGVDVNGKNSAGETALMNCSTCSIVEHLLDRGAGKDIQNSSGKTALQLACENDQYGHSEIADVLDPAGALERNQQAIFLWLQAKSGCQLTVDGVKELVEPRLRLVKDRFPLATHNDLRHALLKYSPESALFAKRLKSSKAFDDKQWEKYQGELKLGSYSEFHNGVTGIIGADIPDDQALREIHDGIVRDGIPAEDRYNLWYVQHCAAVEQTNYDENGKERAPDKQLDQGHDGMRLQHFVDNCNRDLRNARSDNIVTPAQALSMRLYTTSTFRRMNNSLRGFMERVDDSHSDSKQIPLRACVQSARKGIVRLQAIPRPPESSFRGVTGYLPERFEAERIGMDYAFISTSVKDTIAAEFAGSVDISVLFEMEFVAGCPGADISMLSLFPGEKEVLFAPCTGLSLKHIHSTGEGATRSACELCEEEAATQKCHECDQAICSRCAKGHAKSKLSRDHHLTAISAVPVPTVLLEQALSGTAVVSHTRVVVSPAVAKD